MSRLDVAEHPAGSRIFRLPDGAPVLVRPIRPQDAGLLQDYLQRLSPPSRRNRFLGALNELSPRELARLVHMDCTSACVLLAFAGTEPRGAPIGEAVAVVAPASGRAETALSVTDAWQGRGVGTLLMQNIECRARARGTRYLFGDVLYTNTAMKAFARRAGFSIRSPFTDARLVEIVKDLSQSPPALLCREELAALPSIAA
jgi:GNAT superfamily N-acetyltransferase